MFHSNILVLLVLAKLNEAQDHGPHVLAVAPGRDRAVQPPLRRRGSAALVLLQAQDRRGAEVRAPGCAARVADVLVGG